MLILVFVAINLVLVLAIPNDGNAYLCEYNHKIELLETVQQPRIIFVGGSNIAFGLDSKTLSDSLNYNVINFGLHAGMGIRYPLEDCLQYVKQGDVIVIQMEYQNFFSGGFGESETLPQLMFSTHWRNFSKLYPIQIGRVILGLPQIAYGNFKRLIKYPIKKTFNSPVATTKYEYLKSGFNEYGDEESHWNLPKQDGNVSKKETRDINNDFMEYLVIMINKYEAKGAKILLLPPVCPIASYKASHNDNIDKALISIGYPYIYEPSKMALSDTCSFNGGYHVDKEGVRQNTQHIIDALRFLKRE